MKTVKTETKKITANLIFAASVLFSVYLWLAPEYSLFENTAVFFIAGVFLIWLSSGNYEGVFELTGVLLAWLFFDTRVDMHLHYYPLIFAVLAFTGYKTGSMTALFISIFVMTFQGFSALSPLLTGAYGPGGAFVFYMVSIGIVLYVVSFLRAVDYSPGKKIDVLLCSYTGNTAEYASHFINGAEKAGAEINVHRFHYHKRFDAKFGGDSLVIAFPVIGWKPPWPLCSYIIRKLPRGNGKPAFVLYTAAGGPENAGIVAWLLLTLKGYRVVGRLWSIYPMNVPTFRLGPKAVWRFLDKHAPISGEPEIAEKTGLEFALGKTTGLPFVLWPFTLVIFGVLLDNPPLNTVLYRNYAWRRRCKQCGLCVDYCPSERLSMVNGYPKAKGACVLCLGCINICPKNAMHLVCWTEYGFQYKPRWPDGVVKKKE